MSMIRGIAISGKIASGKTTLANHLSQQTGWPVESLAYELKYQVSNALYQAGLNCPPEEIVKLHKAKIRGILQGWGKVFREVNGEDWWIKYLLEQNTAGPFIVDDMRYRNEFDELKKAGFVTVHVTCPWVTLEARQKELFPTMTEAERQDLSETGLDLWEPHHDIIVDGTWNAESTAKAILERINAA